MSPRDPRRFHTTQWGVVLAAGNACSPDARAALAALCETYWAPVHDFIRRSAEAHDDPGHAQDAQDMTQAFFARVLERADLKGARPERGRFRSYLLGAVRHFLADERDRRGALVRGGGATHVPIDIEVEESGAHDRASVVSAGADGLPDHVFEVAWARATLAAAVARVAQEYARVGKSATFEALRRSLDDEARVDYARLADDLGTSEGAARVAVHRCRRHVAAAVRAVLAETVAEDGDIDDELAFLRATLARR